ncbi:ligase-associated DNA damage response endonuclease PdeM [Pseudooceanicola onchidii]|uniref:ligase-associated DNA damage response endonuclease PdeM n=1 Tax=Pseudooceanicola onchidii TaxID=2562279 RepID=UPI0010AA2547|nr:ligase-associated DNA damage response endonuclease PdeM [Pseudooceanicola onchidii]
MKQGTGYGVEFCGASLEARPSGALWWAARDMLVVSDLHLGKSERMARLGGAVLPPYETLETLERLEADLEATGARVVVCLGDSFDDAAAARGLPEDVVTRLMRMQAGRDWVWIEGNHDPGPVSLGGAHLAEMEVGPLVLRHIAEDGAQGEVSGHYHPKVRIAGASRRCFLVDDRRLILPAYGTYTGGLRSRDPALAGLMGPRALAILTGPVARAMPMPR